MPLNLIIDKCKTFPAAFAVGMSKIKIPMDFYHALENVLKSVFFYLPLFAVCANL